MLNLVQSKKYSFMCWKQRDSVGIYHEKFLTTIEVAEAVKSMIGQDVTTDKIALEEWGHDTANPRTITEDKRDTAITEGEKCFWDAIFFSGLSYYRYR